MSADWAADQWEQSPFHCKQLAMTLFWRTKTPARRREGFPSWSWVGRESFAGFVVGQRREGVRGESLVFGDDDVYDVKLSVKTQDGEYLKWNFDRDGAPAPSQPFGRLWVGR